MLTVSATSIRAGNSAMMGARVMTKASIARAPRASVVVLADDDAIPIISGRFKKNIPGDVKPEQHLGGQTLGEELALIRQRYLQAEARAAHAADREFTGGNWDGDVYVGSNWNMLSFLALCMWLLPIIGLVFAYLTYGTLWGVDTMYASPNVMW